MSSVQKVHKELLQSYGDLFAFARQVVVRNRRLAARSYEKKNDTAVVLYHFTKAVNLLDATRRLCFDGFAREAIATSRSLFNLCINLRWLTKPKARSERLRRFTDHEVASKANNAMTLIKWDKNITDEQKANLRRLIRELRPVAKFCGIKKMNDGRYGTWHPLIKDMAKDVKLSSDYYLTYRRLSQTEHTDPESVREYLSDVDDDDAMQGDVGPSSQYAPLVMADSIRYFLNVKRDAAPLLDFAEGRSELEELGRLLNKYQEVFAHY